MSDNNDFDPATLAITTMALILGIVLFLAGALLGQHQTIREKEKEAVLKGHATWAVGKDGSSTFQWKEVTK